MIFEDFKKIPRLFRECTITEKIDGTNGQIVVQLHDEDQWTGTPPMATCDVDSVSYDVWVGSRNRWIYPGGSRDNSGFAQWVSDRLIGLVRTLGDGRHYGEVWGAGIQRRYGLTGSDKRFSLFNTERWKPLEVAQAGVPGLGVVPVLYEGPFSSAIVKDQIHRLRVGGSLCVPDFMDAEGVVVYHQAARSYFKATLLNDEKPKGSTE